MSHSESNEKVCWKPVKMIFVWSKKRLLKYQGKKKKKSLFQWEWALLLSHLKTEAFPPFQWHNFSLKILLIMCDGERSSLHVRYREAILGCSRQTGEERRSDHLSQEPSTLPESFWKGHKIRPTRSCVTSATTGRQKNKSGFRERAGGHTSGKRNSLEARGSHSQLRMEQLNTEIIQLQVSYLRCSWKWCWCLSDVWMEI